MLTVLLEIALARLFGYRQLRLIVWMNIVTQILLNIILNAVNFSRGQWAFTFYYILLELAVFALEAIVYARRLPDKPSRAVWYAFCANALSFAAGLTLAHIIPGIF